MAIPAESKTHGSGLSLPDPVDGVIVFMIVGLIMHYSIGPINPTEGFCSHTNGEGGKAEGNNWAVVSGE